MADGPPLSDFHLYTQELLSSFQGALGSAIGNGITYGEKLTCGSWEFVLSEAREAGQLPAVIHAMFTSMH